MYRSAPERGGPRAELGPAERLPFLGLDQTDAVRGFIDDQDYEGEYNLPRTRRAFDGSVAPGNAIVDADNDGIKAVNYGLYWCYGPAGDRHRRKRGGSMPWEMTYA